VIVLELKFISLANTTGYAVAGLTYLQALAETGINITWPAMAFDGLPA
jgi:hypothetical protein